MFPGQYPLVGEILLFTQLEFEFIDLHVSMFREVVTYLDFCSPPSLLRRRFSLLLRYRGCHCFRNLLSKEQKFLAFLARIPFLYSVFWSVLDFWAGREVLEVDLVAASLRHQDSAPRLVVCSW